MMETAGPWQMLEEAGVSRALQLFNTQVKHKEHEQKEKN